MDSEKGNRVFARGHNVPPPWFLEPKKSLVLIGLNAVTNFLSQRSDVNCHTVKSQIFVRY